MLGSLANQYVSKLVYSFIQFSLFWQVHSLFQNEFSTECDLVLPIEISSIVSFA
jgi:hypothetical protein